MQGILITFEGIDFSGKSVQANLLKERLESRHVPVLLLREPGGTPISEKIREIVLDRTHGEMCRETEVLLYSAARAQMVRECILPHLEKGTTVICDRYFDSTTAYQGIGREIDLNFIKKLNNFSVQEIMPDLTFLIDLAPETALQRHQSKGQSLDRLENEKRDFHKRVREGYLELAGNETERFVIIDGMQSVADIQKEIFDHVVRRLKL